MIEADIRRSLTLIHDFSETQIQAFIARVKTKTLSKKEFLLRPGQTCNYIAFVSKGSLRVFSLSEGVEHTYHFFTEFNWVAEYESFIAQKQTLNFIQALEQTELVIISLDDIHSLMEEFKEFRSLASLIKNWVIPSARLISITGDSPDERYQKLLDTHPEWINRFPQMYIASYLGMTKETFSRVKGRLL
jgi:CRP/FNR family transcriptional regulator, anaerobic regulatory protein